MSQSEEKLIQKLDHYDVEDPRYALIDAALSFKSSWYLLAERLSQLLSSKAFRDWGYATFVSFCRQELYLSPSTANKLVRSYRWLDRKQPESLRAVKDTSEAGKALPDYQSVDVMMKAERALEKAELKQEHYEDLVQKAMTGEPPAVLQQEFREHRIEPLVSPELARERLLRRLFDQSIKLTNILLELEESPDVLMSHADALREWSGEALEQSQKEVLALNEGDTPENVGEYDEVKSDPADSEGYEDSSHE